MKKGVLLVGAIGALNHRKDVIDMVEVIRRTDEGIFICVPSPKGILGVNDISTDRGPNTIDYDLDADKRCLSEETSDAGNSIWVTVKSKGSKKMNKWDLATGSQVSWTSGKALRGTRNSSQG